MRDLILLSPVVLLLLAVLFARLAYLRTNSIISSSTVFTLLFSFGLAIDRTAIPLPTLMFLPIALYDLINAPPCVQTSEGWYAEVDPAGNLMFFLLFLILQWAFWTLIFVLFRFALFEKKR